MCFCSNRWLMDRLCCSNRVDALGWFCLFAFSRVPLLLCDFCCVFCSDGWTTNRLWCLQWSWYSWLSDIACFCPFTLSRFPPSLCDLCCVWSNRWTIERVWWLPIQPIWGNALRFLLWFVRSVNHGVNDLGWVIVWVLFYPIFAAPFVTYPLHCCDEFDGFIVIGYPLLSMIFCVVLSDIVSCHCWFSVFDMLGIIFLLPV